MNLNFTKSLIIPLTLCFFINKSNAQCYWQQHVEYAISVDFDVKTHQYTGSEILKYYNNSPDTLRRVFFHLYFNAFQPNSMMDVRSRNLPDPDGRVMDRISKLSPEEIGYLKVSDLTQSGQALSYELSETVLEVNLAKPILPNSSETFNLKFDGQVPIQIRRSGRDSYEGIDYSMAQWFPKMAEYDDEGWHTSPYIAREFYAPWGDYAVDITIDKNYVLAGTGIVQNKNEVGYGYEDPGYKVKRKGTTLTWKFKAENVHDFVWTADRDYTQITAQVPDGPLLRFFYVPGEETKNWADLPQYMVKSFDYCQKHFGKFGWSQYSFIQGGDGGMEYPMATLIANKTKGRDGNPRVATLNSLVGVSVHESLHSWYQGMLATNESYYAWMDEGFTSFAEAYTENYVFDKNEQYPMAGTYRGYYHLVKTGKEEPLTMHSDHFNTNMAYSIGSYTKGAISLEQLGYIIGKENLDKGLLKYHKQWSFKHPDMNDFIKVMETQSGLELSWYYDYWVKTTYTIDYGIKSVTPANGGTSVTLQRIKEMPMPMDLVIKLADGSSLEYYIPLTIMRGEKPAENSTKRIVGKDWPWTHPEYTFQLEVPSDQIISIQIDPTGRMADVDTNNNIYKKGE